MNFPARRLIAPCWRPIVVALFFVLIPAGITQAISADEAARQEKLKAELVQVEADIAKNSQLLSAKQKESASLKRDVDVLNYQIATAKLKIREKQLEIQRLGTDIVKKEVTVRDLNQKIEAEKQSLAELLRKTREMDNTSVVEAALKGDNMSDVFADLNAFNYIQGSLHNSFGAIKQTRSDTEVQKSGLENRRDASIDAKAAIERENKKVQALEVEKQDLLKLSKNQESNYKRILADRQKKRSEILSALFSLRDTKAIPFEQALAYAKEAAGKTGVRPAFILAIMTQETNLGANVGTCNRPGDPEKKSWKNIMKPSRDIEPYLRITKALGIAPDTMPLSCPQGSGYGGAMGPSQFIPSTWELYEDRIASVTGHNPPNPWVAEDAFAATSLYLMDLGAAGSTYSAESRAAGKYYAGSRWATAGKSYSNSVMAISERIQNNIDFLNN
ncbi:MAG: lytic murein transglycosylase [Candidatus Vogelbacteria bacterium]|nr:lytic murein transglycosylase [Candidatus Vogelbacteria bacterium]